ncbi:cytosolic phospholipase A2 gamma [Gastrophryne carolinensis]
MDCTKDNLDVVDGYSNVPELQGEKISIMARQKKITRSLSALGLDITENSAPVIAVMGSGGGLRAMVAFFGTIVKLSDLKLLDAVTYLCGVSGSTWCMSLLYKDEKWSDDSHIEKIENQFIDQLTSKMDLPWNKIKEAFLKDPHSLTDFWAYAVVHNMTKEMNEKNLSSYKVACENGENPYPVFSAVEKASLKKNDKDAWFEFTPHLSGFPAKKTYVKTEHFGSKFKAGKLEEKLPEKEMCYLAGMWGSALGSDNVLYDIIEINSSAIKAREIGNIIPDSSCSCPGCKIKRVHLSKDRSEMTKEEKEKYWQTFAEALQELQLKESFLHKVLLSFYLVNSSTIKAKEIGNIIPNSSCSCPGCKIKRVHLSKDLSEITKEEKKKYWQTFAEALQELQLKESFLHKVLLSFYLVNPSAIKAREIGNIIPDSSCSCPGCKIIRVHLSKDRSEMTKEEKEKYWQTFAEALHECQENKFMAGRFSASDFCENIKAVHRIACCIAQWQWGTTNNFLYQLKDDSASELFGKEHLSLIDAGLEINVAFPLMLPPHRNVDLILSFDFSEGDPFLTLTQTEEYCEKHQVPFPKININENEKNIPSKCCYIFKGDGKGTPDVMHFPLFNNETSNGKVHEMRETYATAKYSYNHHEVIQLLEVAKSNVERSFEQIQDTIKAWIKKRTAK